MVFRLMSVAEPVAAAGWVVARWLLGGPCWAARLRSTSRWRGARMIRSVYRLCQRGAHAEDQAASNRQPEDQPAQARGRTCMIDGFLRHGGASVARTHVAAERQDRRSVLRAGVGRDRRVHLAQNEHVPVRLGTARSLYHSSLSKGAHVRGGAAAPTVCREEASSRYAQGGECTYARHDDPARCKHWCE
jgi:hypothetical protein